MAERENGEKEKAEKAEKIETRPSSAAIAKAIEGLEFRTNKAMPVLDDSTGKPIMEGGKPKLYYIPDRRPMTKADVLNARYDNGQLVLVSKDGSKYRIGSGTE